MLLSCKALKERLKICLFKQEQVIHSLYIHMSLKEELRYGRRFIFCPPCYYLGTYLGSKQIAAIDIVLIGCIPDLEFVLSKLSRLNGFIGWIENFSVPTSNAPDVTHANSEAVGSIRMQSGKGGVAHAQFLGTF